MADPYENFSLKSVTPSEIKLVAEQIIMDIGAAAGMSWSQISYKFFDTNGDEIGDILADGVVDGTVTGIISGAYAQQATARRTVFDNTLDLANGQSFEPQQSQTRYFEFDYATPGGTVTPVTWQAIITTWGGGNS